MKKPTMKRLASALLAGGTLAAMAGSAQADILFWSTQAKPVEETQAMREQVLSGFSESVDYQASDTGPWLTRIQAELEAGQGTIGLLGGLHGDFTTLADNLVDLSDVDLGGVSVNDTFQQLGRLGTDEQKYLPWMQATYIMAANRKALDYLPEGADINALTYDELIAWMKTLAEETGGPKFGFPAGPKGLKHRFFQGYLYPSYTDSMVTKFRSAEAEEAWNKFKELWAYTNPASTSFAFMQEQLLTEEVWVAFDHTARLAEAFNQRPDDFVAFPAPAGPTGRGFMPVVAGVAVPETAPDMEKAKALAAYMLKPETQIATLRATNFFPVVDVELPDDMPAAVRISGAAIAAMSGAEDANPGLLPMGLGDLGGKFNQVYNDTFERIVLAGQDVRAVLDDQAEALRAIMEEAGAPCWAPDEPSEGACPVE
ncbi:ABC transporter substrate-binding protein [Chelativorans intermedius]|uniref:ABC transporter substrate-binding protein n=1 Tax=Chelativorans intermedius TaxID=515947 RepID=A0ABV6D935_9HYPH|nr:ABC transporter substrate-binding protein [Chelativorans intermedius]MCT8998708.1 ABC transporter substrate-binding protein [Chelativorans intermedius]